ncbi:hypothetical protein [Pseudomonas sp.]|uniref:hypothetical protein n=1 Tax=Pseudomonas sp. TaxID=306 RepID=UPI0028A62D08|nr:hypothetical protein [Pseudomonas sp.]
MPNRGIVFWEWADPTLHSRSITERLGDGRLIDVQVRMSAQWDVQLFIGVYESNGALVFEEAFQSRPGETMSKALVWGVARANEQALSIHSPPPAGKTRKAKPGTLT